MMKRYTSFLLGLFLLVLLFGSAPPAFAQQGSIEGTVTDANTGDPLPGANVILEEVDEGTTTGQDGRYSLQVEPDTYTLRISFIGYQEAVRENVQVAAGGTVEIDVQLSPSQEQLEEVVVVGYGEQQREEVTGAVAQVSASDVEDVSAASVSETLQGQASGLMVHRTGVPGTAPEVRIRGLNTLNSNDPLFIVDGVERDNLVGLNSANIESVEVLKDASSAAIYGSRASGGVVLITTKDGRAGELQVDVNSSVGFKNPHQRLDLLNTRQYMELNTELRQNANSSPPARFDQEGFPEEFSTTNWQDAYFQNSVYSNNNIAVSGGTESARARVSLGYLTEGGSVVETGYERYSLRVNSNYDLGRFQLSENLSLTYGEDKLRRGDGLEGIIQMPPYIPVHSEENLGGYDGVDQIDGADKPNPVREEEFGTGRTQSTQITGNITAEMQILEFLNLRSVLGLDATWSDREEATPPFFEGDFHSQDFTSISEGRSRIIQPVSTTTLNLDQLVLGNHEFNSTLGFEIQNTRVDIKSLNGRNDLTDQTSIATIPRPGFDGSVGEDVLISTFGRVTYNYDGRYQLQGSLRRDGYSRFGRDNKYGLFPSASVGWNLGQEAFMEDVTTVSTLRLRGSWGFTGNKEALNRYEYQSTFNTGGDYNFGGEVVTAAAIDQLANANLEWERSQSINVGVDLGFLNDAVTLTTEYFRNTNEDILLNVPLPNSFGYSGDTRANTATVVSDGFEVQAGYESRSTGDFFWSVNLNFSHSSNEVESLGIGNPINAQSWGWGGSTASKRLEEGQPIFYWYGWEVDRLFQQDDFNENGNLKEGIPDHRATTAPGDIKFKDLNGDGKVDAQDQTNLGDPQPDYTFGLQGDASWGAFDASIFLQGVAGFQIAPAYQGFSRGMTRVWNHETAVLDRWTPQNTDTDVPRAVDGDPNNNSRFSDRFVQDGDYLRLKRITIGYTPEFITGLSQVRSARIYIRGEDLLTLTGYDGLDPEVVNSGGDILGFGYDDNPIPRPRRFQIGVQLGF
jgi:TonB-linked SusC/RagA family outer membrane protein